MLKLYKTYSFSALLVLLSMILFVSCWTSARAAVDREVNVITIEGAIDPPSADYLKRALTQAQENEAEALIIRLNTPGGLGTSMDKMTNLLLNSPVPTVVYVSPRGAQAFSAGTFVTLAANFAAMAPGATIGAAHPVQMGGGSEAQPDPVMTEKITNAYAKTARAIAKERKHNAEWAEEAVRNSIAATADEAPQKGVIDTIQPNLGALLTWLGGKTAEVEGGEVVLRTQGAQVVSIPPSVKDRFLHQLADPNPMLILMAIAAMGILFELQNPGAIFPGVIGGIALLLALYAMSVLPVTTAGIALIGFGILLLILEIKLPSHGILTIGGITAFIIGGIMLIDTDYAHIFRMSIQVVVAVALLVGAFFAFAVGAAVRAHMRKPTTGKEGLLGAVGSVTTAVSEAAEGEVWVEGEHWRARSKQGSLAPGDKIEVVDIEGLTLLVRPVVEK